jgi:hypothetical protein
MNQELIKQQLNEWMINFVEKPNPQLGNWAPCPYARKARIENKIVILFAEADDLENQVELALSRLEGENAVEAFAVCFDHTKITPEELESRMQKFNAELMPRNYVVLEDHPGYQEYIAGVRMNFNHCGLLLVQYLSQLNEAAAKLKDKGYYDVWSEKNLEWVVKWREHGEVLQDQSSKD